MKLTPERRAFFIGFQAWVAAQPPARQRQIRRELWRLFLERLKQLHADAVVEDLLREVDLS
ncbi:MAG: hypothetical protein KDD84_23705 [Caldilineaceae bacterium]|nr:hypothetical protein [Caldilineaceae bacterium]